MTVALHPVRSRPRGEAPTAGGVSRSAAVAVVVAVVVLLATGAAVVASVDTTPSIVLPLLSVLIGTSAWLTVTRLRRGELLAPYSLTMILLVSIYGIRPLFMIGTGDFGFYGINIWSGFNLAALVGYYSITLVTAGYVLAASRSRAAEPVLVATAKPHSIVRSTLLVGLLIGGWFAAIAFKGGGLSFIVTLYHGRSATTSLVLAGMPGAVSVMPVAGAIVVATVRMLEERRRKLTVGEQLLFWISIVATVIPPLALGTRRFLLPCLVAAAIAVVTPRARAAVSVRIVIGVLVSFVLLAIVPFIRSAGSRVGSQRLSDAATQYLAANGVLGTIKPFFVSFDTEMFNYVAYLAPRLGHTVPYGYGRGTIGDLLLNPFPASLAPAQLWSDKLLIWTFGEPCSPSSCPVPSVSGVLLYDLGWVGLLVGCLLLGYLCQGFSRGIQRHAGYRLTLLVAAGAFVPVLVRGSTVNIVYLMVMAMIIACVLMQLTAGGVDRFGAPHRPRPPSGTRHQTRTRR